VPTVTLRTERAAQERPRFVDESFHTAPGESDYASWRGETPVSSFLARVTLFGCSLIGAMGCSKVSEPNGPASSAASEPSAAAPSPEPAAAKAPSVPEQVEPFAGGCDAYLAANREATTSKGTTCSGTEQALFARDPTGECLGCFFQSGCLDDTNGDTGQECEDLSSPAAKAQCLAALRCDLGPSPGSGPAPSAGLAVNAYCGVGTQFTKCTTEGPAGVCVAPIAAGFPAGFTPAQIVTNFAVRKHPAGMANAIVACGVSAAQRKSGAACGKCLR